MQKKPRTEFFSLYILKELVTKRDVDMALIRRGVKRLKGANQEEMVCAVCPTPRRFKGWGALLIHAERYVKEKARQHRGYFRALKQVLQEEENTNSCGDHFQKNGRKDVQPPAQSLISAQAGLCISTAFYSSFQLLFCNQTPSMN